MTSGAPIRRNRQRPRVDRARAARDGMTLFEIFLALAIFTAALAVVTEIIHTGTRASLQAQLQSEATLRAESRMAEAAAGVVPLQGVSNSAFEDDPGWTWSLTVGDGPHADTLQLTVTVSHTLKSGVINGQSTLTRLIRNPQVFDDAAASVTTSGSTSSSSSGGSR